MGGITIVEKSSKQEETQKQNKNKSVWGINDLKLGLRRRINTTNVSNYG
jgi:hypothetical protein